MRKWFNSKAIPHHPGRLTPLASRSFVLTGRCLGWNLNGKFSYNSGKYEAEVRFECSTTGWTQSIDALVKKLQQLHDKHLTRPDFDENSSEEKEIESVTKDITTVMHRSHHYSL